MAYLTINGNANILPMANTHHDGSWFLLQASGQVTITYRKKRYVFFERDQQGGYVRWIDSNKPFNSHGLAFLSGHRLSNFTNPNELEFSVGEETTRATVKNKTGQCRLDFEKIILYQRPAFLTLKTKNKGHFVLTDYGHSLYHITNVLPICLSSREGMILTSMWGVRLRYTKPVFRVRNIK